jgi:hypothetical protein
VYHQNLAIAMLAGAYAYGWDLQAFRLTSLASLAGYFFQHNGKTAKFL